MNAYGKEILPKLYQPTEKKYYLNSTQSYMAASVAKQESAIKNEIDNLNSDIETSIKNFNKQLDALRVSFGTKFIAINNEPLNFVDVETFDTLTKALKTSLENSEANVQELFSNCKEKIEEINTWLNDLQTNYNIYNEYVRQYNNCINSENEEIKAKASTYNTLLSEFSKLPGTPLDYGEWIKE